MRPPSLPLTLPYATRVERDFARARFVAALVTGPAGVLLLMASGGELVLGVLGLACVLAGIGWLVAARRGLGRARERAAWQLSLSEERLSFSTETGDQHVPRSGIEALALDEDTLQVVVTAENMDELRLEATWGTLGVVDLHALLLAWWRPEGSLRAHDN
jgi:hypothetical protein